LTDPILLAAAAGVGALVGLGAAYSVFYSRPKEPKVKTLERDESGALRSGTVSSGEVEHSRREMRALMLERDLLSSALMKVYEAETEGRITKDEREMIAKRYSDQIKSMQDKLKDVELIVEVGELERLRDELLTLFREKIQNIEARLDQAKDKLGVAAPPDVVKKLAPVPKVENIETLEKVVQRRARPEMTDAERRVKEIREEVMEALTKLEQIDLEKKPQANA
jgi:hypothetical protein